MLIQSGALERGAFCQRRYRRSRHPVNLHVFGDKGNTAITTRVNGDEGALVR